MERIPQQLEEISVIKKGRELKDLSIQELKKIKTGYLEIQKTLKHGGIEKALDDERDEEDFYTEAQEVMGENFYGVEAIEKALGFAPHKDSVPAIPYSIDELEQAKARGERLVLRISHDNEGKPMTMQRINELMESRLDPDTEGKLLYDTSWYAEEVFYTTDALEDGWKLVGGSLLEGSTDQNYIHQTRVLRECLKVTGGLTELEEKTCTDAVLQGLSAEMGVDFGDQTITDPALYEKKWTTVARKLAELPINQNHRRTPKEIIYDWALRFKVSEGDRDFLEINYEHSSCVSSGGYLVCVGSAGADGAGVDGWGPGSRGGVLGVVVVR